MIAVILGVIKVGENCLMESTLILSKLRKAVNSSIKKRFNSQYGYHETINAKTIRFGYCLSNNIAVISYFNNNKNRIIQ